MCIFWSYLRDSLDGLEIKPNFQTFVNHVKVMKWLWKCLYSNWHLIHKLLTLFHLCFWFMLCFVKPFQTLCCCSGQYVGFKWLWPPELGSKFYQNTPVWLPTCTCVWIWYNSLFGFKEIFRKKKQSHAVVVIMLTGPWILNRYKVEKT